MLLLLSSYRSCCLNFLRYIYIRHTSLFMHVIQNTYKKNLGSKVCRSVPDPVPVPSYYNVNMRYGTKRQGVLSIGAVQDCVLVWCWYSMANLAHKTFHPRQPLTHLSICQGHTGEVHHWILSRQFDNL